jgi:hypothetical protein
MCSGISPWSQLFNIFTSNLSDVISEDFYKIAYADDTYVALSCHPNDYHSTKEKLVGHFDWLKSLGVLVNPSKTEFIVLHPVNDKVHLERPSSGRQLQSCSTKILKIQGIHFSHTNKQSIKIKIE